MNTEESMEVPNNPIENVELPYDIPTIKKFRWFMLCVLAIQYCFGWLSSLEPNFYPLLIQFLAVGISITAVVLMAIVASKTYRKTWVTVLVVVLSFIPVVSLLTCLYLSVHASGIIRAFDKRRY